MHSDKLEEILDRLHSAQHDLEIELDRILDEKRRQFEYQLQRGRVVFALRMRQLQRQWRTGLWKYITGSSLLFVLSSPLIYGMIMPLLLLDLTVSFYQQVCFRIYRIPRVRRRDYLVIDRHHLAYLNAIEKLNCVYCGYANGLIEYVRMVIARTEQYWCPIKHARRPLDEHSLAQRFFDYGDAEAYRKDLDRLRRQWDDQALGSQQGNR